MISGQVLRAALLCGAALLTGAAQMPVPAPTPAKPSAPVRLDNELAHAFAPRTDTYDYSKREVMIAMRDGVHLHTVIIVPRGAHRAPILLTRTPYGAAARFGAVSSAHLSAVMGDHDVADELVTQDGYIRVIQDVRGKYGSEGDYAMTRPLRGPLNPTGVDHSTDTYDTIEWLVHNVPESNGRVGMLGISYDGFTTLMALVHPHPALRAVVPINAMVDGWRGDDWFHNGAFRQASLVYAHDQEATRDSSLTWWADHYDDYDTWLSAGSAGDMARLHGLDQVGFTAKLMFHPAYDAFWQGQALDKLLAREPVSVPTMLVHSLWDQEDIFGNIAVWKAIKPNDAEGRVFLVLGPWFHHQQRLDGSAVGPIAFGADTAAHFRHELLKPFFDHFLKDDTQPLTIPTVAAFETGTNQWRGLKTWPSGCDDGCRIDHVPMYLQPGGKLSATAPAASVPGFDSYISDPAKPVPYLPRPIHIEGNAGEASWQTWLTSDQRDAASRTDVLTYTSPVLTTPLKITGEPVANLFASTTGTDGDFVVKLIDVYPEEMGRDPRLGGYQLMVSADILRGRYRDNPSKPSAMPSDQKQTLRFALPTANHVFLPGHRLMVQVQSSWFPLYDRNPQTFVKNIFFAKPGDYRRATIKVFDGGPSASFIDLPVVQH